MVQRSTAMCNGKIIGIESIYTVVEGRQINKPDELKLLRTKSQNNELFCPCGCGANQILVAGDRNLRKQHFRIKDYDNNLECCYKTEGKESVDSKIVLKCWLDDNLNTDDLESRVPINLLSDSNRKYEFTFISRIKSIALNYCHDRANLSEEKMQILHDNSDGIRIIHIVDYKNGGTNGQYPEALMKIQNKQGYCLLLRPFEDEYNKAILCATVYKQDLDDLWEEILIAEAPLRDYKIMEEGDIYLHGQSIKSLLDKAIAVFDSNNEEKKQHREEIKRIRESRLEQQERQIEEAKQRKRQEAIEREQEKREEEKRKKLREKEFIENLQSNIEYMDKPAIDENGTRWVKCQYCGRIATESEFVIYGGSGRNINLGTCKVCINDKHTQIETHIPIELSGKKRTTDSMVCPICGSVLILRNGKNGPFMGCKGFPDCRYTRSVRREWE